MHAAQGSTSARCAASMAEVDHRKIYAKGFYDALRTLGMEGTSMNQAKFESAHRGFSAQAKKIYDCIPISEAWSPSQIMQELHRRNISMSDMRVVMGCMNTMIDSGCIVESPKGMFSRAEIRQAKIVKTPVLVAVKTIEEPPMKPMLATSSPLVSTDKPQTTGPIERLSALAARLRDLATDMETTALELAEQAEKNDTDTAKMRQLQALLKSLG